MSQVAFWTDIGTQYPYILSGKISKWLPTGKVEMSNWGAGFQIKPELVLSTEEAVKYNNKLSGLLQEYVASQLKLRVKFQQKLIEIKL